MKKNFIDIFNEIRNLRFSFLVLYFISLTLLYQYAYYRAFHIDITSFISISDLYTLLIDLFPGLIFFFGYLIVIFVIMFSINAFINKIRNLFNKEKEKKEEIKRKFNIYWHIFFPNFMNFFIFYLTVFKFAFPFILTPQGRNLYDTPFIFLVRISLIFAFIMFFLSSLKINENSKRFFTQLQISVSKVKMLSLGLTVFYIVGFTSNLNAAFNMKFGSESTVEFEFNDLKISSLDKNIVFVGKTNEYLFLFYKDLTITKSYKISEAKNLSFFNSIYYNEITTSEE